MPGAQAVQFELPSVLETVFSGQLRGRARQRVRGTTAAILGERLRRPVCAGAMTSSSCGQLATANGAAWTFSLGSRGDL